MNTVNNRSSSKTYPSEIVLETKRTNSLRQNYFLSINGSLSFYSLKSISRVPIIKNIKVEGLLKEDGTLNIYIKEEEFIHEIEEIKETIKCKYGLGFILFPGTVFFKGSFMDGFIYKDLSENTSTYIVNGDMVSFNKAKRVSSIGKLKKIEDIIHLNSSVTFACKSNIPSKFQKRSTSNFIGIDISMQFKKEAA